VHVLPQYVFFECASRRGASRLRVVFLFSSSLFSRNKFAVFLNVARAFQKLHSLENEQLGFDVVRVVPLLVSVCDYSRSNDNLSRATDWSQTSMAQ